MIPHLEKKIKKKPLGEIFEDYSDFSKEMKGPELENG